MGAQRELRSKSAKFESIFVLKILRDRVILRGNLMLMRQDLRDKFRGNWRTGLRERRSREKK